ncbi:hypothetical protein [Actinoplanes sp. NPDC051851]|uniref:hypothetical protein n=1 Tax=Actinoplanes sp. NPDC051851 TaxID=3154753 RepID=UPI003416D514
MKAERSITAARYSAGQTIEKLSTFATDVLAARHYPHTGPVGDQLRSLTPLFNLLLATRTAGSPALVVRTGDMEIALRIDYDMNAEDNLSVPSMGLLDELPADATVEIAVLVTEEVAPALAALVSRADRRPARITLTDAASWRPERPEPGPDVPPVPEPAGADDGETSPDDATRAEQETLEQETLEEETARPAR